MDLKFNIGQKNYLVQKLQDVLSQEPTYKRLGINIQSYVRDALHYTIRHGIVDYKVEGKEYLFIIGFDIPLINKLNIEHKVDKAFFDNLR